MAVQYQAVQYQAPWPYSTQDVQYPGSSTQDVQYPGSSTQAVVPRAVPHGVLPEYYLGRYPMAYYLSTVPRAVPDSVLSVCERYPDSVLSVCERYPISVVQGHMTVLQQGRRAG